MHFIAPEYIAGAITANAIASSLTPAIDIFSFGMCALEMAALEIQGNGDSGTVVTQENIHKTIESLEDNQQKDFIYKCLSHEPTERPCARDLLFHPLLFEVHSLKLLAAHYLLNTARKFFLKIF
jgi:nuclear receptor-binding protein